VQRKQAEREAAAAADQALVAESRRIMDAREQARKDEMQRRADKIQVRACVYVCTTHVPCVGSRRGSCLSAVPCLRPRFSGTVCTAWR
jgi:hypothetical protein